MHFDYKLYDNVFKIFCKFKFAFFNTIICTKTLQFHNDSTHLEYMDK